MGIILQHTMATTTFSQRSRYWYNLFRYKFCNNSLLLTTSIDCWKPEFPMLVSTSTKQQTCILHSIVFCRNELMKLRFLWYAESLMENWEIETYLFDSYLFYKTNKVPMLLLSGYGRFTCAGQRRLLVFNVFQVKDQ